MLDLFVIRAGDFLRLDAEGRYDLAESRRALAGLAASMVQRGVDRAVLDVRGTQGRLSTTELYVLASTFHEAGFRRQHRLAVIHRPNAMERADFFALVAANRGWSVCAFDGFEDAFEWLSTREPMEPPPLSTREPMELPSPDLSGNPLPPGTGPPGPAPSGPAPPGPAS